MLSNPLKSSSTLHLLKTKQNKCIKYIIYASDMSCSACFPPYPRVVLGGVLQVGPSQKAKGANYAWESIPNTREAIPEQ
jgi:hypothetical protein